jgi:hypothetical protein
MYSLESYAVTFLVNLAVDNYRMAVIPCDVHKSSSREPDLTVTSVNYKLSDFMAQGGPPQ